MALFAVAKIVTEEGETALELSAIVANVTPAAPGL